MNGESDPRSLHQKEADFHDRWAAQTPLDRIAVRAVFESPSAMENKFILRRMGALRGMRLLDVGSGLGESAVYFALQGADVTATDVSPGMADRAAELARFHGTSITAIACAAEAIAAPDNHFDLVYIANTLHHVAGKRLVFQQIRRVLKPGGRFFSMDPLAYNPAIHIYRRMATSVRTPDERPLSFADVTLAREFFPGARHREFWIASLALFAKYFIVDRIHPNADRYWKRIYEPQSLWWWLPLREADRLLTRLPLLRRMAWNMVMWGTKPR